MPKKKGALSITPEQRILWLKRHGNGESVFKIALNAGVDHRTVTKHIEIARSEFELKEERSAVLRKALESHFADLLNIIDTMLFCIDTVRLVEFSGDNEFLKDALQDHIPRSSIWKLLQRWNSDITDLTLLETHVRDKLERQLVNDSELNSINERKGGGLFKRIHATLKYNPKERAQGLPSFDVESPEKEVRLNLSRTIRSTIPAFVDLDEKETIVINDVISRIDSEMEYREEFTGFGDICSKLADTQAKLKKELRVLKWKRIVPGRCRLCPM